MRSNSKKTAVIWVIALILCIVWATVSSRLFDAVPSFIIALVGAVAIGLIARAITRPIERRSLARMYEENETEQAS